MEYGYEEFVEEFRQLLLAVTGYGEERIYYKEECEIPVTAGDRLFMVCAENEDQKEICGVHIRELYENYKDGTPMEILLKDVMEQIHNLKQSGMIGKSLELDDYEKLKDSLCIRLLNKRKNSWDMKDAVYKTIGDIAIVLYLTIGEANGILTTMKIRKTMMKDWGVKEEEVFETAMLNSYRQAPPRIYPWIKWLENTRYYGEAFMDLDSPYLLNKGAAGNCLSTTNKTNGAVAVFYPGVADRIAGLLNDSFFMVFTSVHEVMIHSEESSDVDMLRRVLRDTVKTSTPAEDFLSYNIFYYDKDWQKFSVVH